MVGERATGAAREAASGEITAAADVGEALAAGARAAASAAGEAAAVVTEKAGRFARGFKGNTKSTKDFNAGDCLRDDCSFLNQFAQREPMQ
jgi:hypothetical protein